MKSRSYRKSSDPTTFWSIGTRWTVMTRRANPIHCSIGLIHTSITFVHAIPIWSPGIRATTTLVASITISNRYGQCWPITKHARGTTFTLVNTNKMCLIAESTIWTRILSGQRGTWRTVISSWARFRRNLAKITHAAPKARWALVTICLPRSFLKSTRSTANLIYRSFFTVMSRST